jgi:hypothetical protein
MANILIRGWIMHFSLIHPIHRPDNVRSHPEFKVQHETQFHINCNRRAATCSAELYVEGKPKIIAEGTRSGHIQAIHELENEVEVRAHRRMYGRI